MKLRIKSREGNILMQQELTKFPATIGRGSSSTIVIPNAKVSSNHAAVNWDGKELTVIDQGSSNGTYFEDNKVTEQSCALPCSFRLGKEITLEFYEEAPVKSLAVRPSYSVAFQPLPAISADSRIVKSYDRFWHMIKKMSPRIFLLVMVTLSFLFASVHFIVFQEKFVHSLLTGIGSAAASMLLAAIASSMIALLGLLVRGEYDFKPLFYQCSFTTTLLAVNYIVLRPAFLLETFGILAEIVAVIILFFTSIFSIYIFLFNTFPHRWGNGLAGLTIVLGILAFIGSAKDFILLDKQKIMHDALVGDIIPSRNLAGKEVQVKAVSDELREFGKRFGSQ